MPAGVIKFQISAGVRCQQVMWSAGVISFKISAGVRGQQVSGFIKGQVPGVSSCQVTAGVIRF